MATRRHYPEDWSPVPQKLTARRSQYEPRNEQVRLPKSAERALQPKPLNVPSKFPEDRKTSRDSAQCRKDSSQSSEALSDPRVVDVGPLSTWQRNSPAQRSFKRKQSPSIASTRQSEVSIGILDYYMRDQSLALSSPDLAPPTPQINAAGGQFDFGTPSPCTLAASRQASAIHPTRPRVATRTVPVDQPLAPLSPPVQPRQEATVSRGYTLFPAIKEVTPPRQALAPLTPKESTDLSIFTTTPPEATYRPRKESITSSPVRSRNDSLQTRLPKQRAPIPLRILSSSSNTISTPRPSSTGSRGTASSTPTTAVFAPSYTSGPYHQSHWSDDITTTISVPSPSSTIVAPPPPSSGGGPGRRTSFGSLLRRDSHARHDSASPYGEDDDDEGETAHMLGRKWAWKKSSWRSSDGWSERESRALRKGVREICEVYDEERERAKGKWWRGLLCGCAGQR